MDPTVSMLMGFVAGQLAVEMLLPRPKPGKPITRAEVLRLLEKVDR